MTMSDSVVGRFPMVTPGGVGFAGTARPIGKIGIDNVPWAIDYPDQPMKLAMAFIGAFDTERIHHIAPR